MISSSSSDSQDSLIEEQEIVSNHCPSEKSFIEHCQNEKKNDNEDKTCFSQDIPRSMQLMFIMFSFYRKEVTDIGIEFNCVTKISLNRIKIVSNVSENDMKNCKEKILKLVQRLVYTQLFHDNRIKIYLSPYFREQGLRLGFNLAKFNKKIYCFSTRLCQKQLLTRMKDLFWALKIYPVTFKKDHSPCAQIFTPLRSFFHKMLHHYKAQSLQRNITVEINVEGNRIHCIGNVQRDLVAVKNLYKNLLESTVVLVAKLPSQRIKFVESKVASLEFFLAKSCQFPVVVSKLAKKEIVLISKENVLKKLMEKNKIVQFLEINKETQVGMFLLKKQYFNEKKMMIEELCSKRGYDFASLGSTFHYFKKMFIHENEQNDSGELVRLIIDVLKAMKESKKKYEIPSQIIKGQGRRNDEIQVMEGEFYQSGEIQLDKELSLMMKRDVICETIKMSKPSLVKYKVAEGEESPITWYEDQKKNKILCELKNMKQGVNYYKGKVKKNGETQLYYFESKLTMI